MKQWFEKNGTKFSYFIVGWCTFACLDALVRGEIIFAIINGLLAYLNYQLGETYDT